MYIVINKTENINYKYEGNFPSRSLEEMLNKGDQLIVISTYSNTIKVPEFVEEYGEKVWSFVDFPYLKY